MTLSEYLDREGRGAKSRLARAAGLRWATIHDLAEGRQAPRLETARLISSATGGLVSVAELLDLAAADVVPMPPNPRAA